MPTQLKKSFHNLRQQERIEKLFSAANSALADARVAFVTLFFLTLLLASVASTTTHLDLLLGSKISLPTQNVEVSRQAMLLIGSIILMGIHFQALRSHLLAGKQLAGLSRLSPNPHMLGLELKTNMITDAFFTSVGNNFSRIISNTLLGSVLLFTPLATLFFVQLVTLPAHSNLLTGIVRAILLIDTTLTIVAIVLFSNYLKSSRVQWRFFPHSYSLWLAIVFTLLPAIAGLTIAIFPGEAYEESITRIVSIGLPQLVAKNDLKTDEKVSFLGLECIIDDGYKNNQRKFLENEIPSFSINSPDVFRARPNASKTEVAPICRHYGTSLISTVTVMTWLESMTGFNISRTLQLQGQAITGQTLPANERSLLSEHSDTQPLHPDFANTLSKIIRVDLSAKDLRYANFDNAFMPRVKLSGKSIQGATFRNANLQGATIINYQTAHATAYIAPGKRLASPFDSADLSAANFVNPLFLAETIESVKAIATNFGECRFAGVEVRGGLWQGATFNYCSFQEYEINKKARLASRILSANMAGTSFIKTDIHRVFFGSEPGWTTSSASLDSSTWPQSRITNGTHFSEITLRGADFSDTEIGEIKITKSDLSFSAFKSKADVLFSADSTLNPVFMFGKNYIGPLHENQKLYFISIEKNDSKICFGSNSGFADCKTAARDQNNWRSIALNLRGQSCDLAAQADGFNPDLSNQMVNLFSLGGLKMRKYRDIAEIPPTVRGERSSCGTALSGKKTAITLTEIKRQ